MALVFQEKLHPVIDSVHPLSDFRQAMERLLAGDLFGKIVIAINPTETDRF